MPTTDPTSSGTSAAAESSLESVSSVPDRRGQHQALSLRDGRMRPLENIPAEDEAGPTVLSTEVEEVSPDRGPTTGGVRIIILGKNFPSGWLYARFGKFVTCTVSEALHWLGDWTDRVGAVDSAECRGSAMRSPSSISSRHSQSHFVAGAVSRLPSSAIALRISSMRTRVS